MSQMLRVILVAILIALLIHFLNSLHPETTDIEIEYKLRPPRYLKKIMTEIKKKNKDRKYQIVDLNFKMPRRLPTDLKYVLKWTQAISHYSNDDFINGQRPFIDHNCSFYNCFMTNDKSLLPDLRYFDAILFDVENDWDEHPYTRSLHQKYIFTASEPAGLYPICDPLYNNYYNLTWSYKLDSTIPQPFFDIYFKNGTLAGPKKNMSWMKSPVLPIESLKPRFEKKKKLAAWFVSHCKTKSKREVLVADVTRYLEIFNLTVDIYGWCGKHICPMDDLNTCLEMLQTDYFFYLAFENSLDEDYVTEKVLHALEHYTVPVVFGGADYSRFLPPNSYIDASNMTPEALASLMIEVSGNMLTYQEYFTWHENYYYKANSLGSNLCQLCEILNEPDHHSELKTFTQWWNSGGSCQKERKGDIANNDF